MDNKLILAIDFDGTIVEIDYPHIGKLKKDAVKYINKLYAEGYIIVINSCRADEVEEEMCKFLCKMGIKYHHVNKNDPSLIEYYGFDTRKISADIYIDDKNLGGLPRWKRIYKMIQKYAKCI